MRIVGEIPHPDCKITLFSWNNRYIIKLEHGLLEQTFKIDQFDIDEASLPTLVNATFVQEALHRFDDMNQSFRKALETT